MTKVNHWDATKDAEKGETCLFRLLSWIRSLTTLLTPLLIFSSYGRCIIHELYVINKQKLVRDRCRDNYVLTGLPFSIKEIYYVFPIPFTDSLPAPGTDPQMGMPGSTPVREDGSVRAFTTQKFLGGIGRYGGRTRISLDSWIVRLCVRRPVRLLVYSPYSAFANQ